MLPTREEIEALMCQRLAAPDGDAATGDEADAAREQPEPQAPPHRQASPGDTHTSLSDGEVSR